MDKNLNINFNKIRFILTQIENSQYVLMRLSSIKVSVYPSVLNLIITKCEAKEEVVFWFVNNILLKTRKKEYVRVWENMKRIILTLNTLSNALLTVRHILMGVSVLEPTNISIES